MFTTPPSYLLKQVRLLDPLNQVERNVDVVILDGKIVSLNPQIESIPASIVTIDSQNQILAPALVDLYSSISVPFHQERETFSSLLQGAQAGGFAALNLLAEQSDSIAILELLQQRLKNEQTSMSVRFWGQTSGQNQMSDLVELSQMGVVGFTHNSSLQDLGFVRRVLEYLKPIGLPLAITPLNSSLAGKGVIREGVDSLRFGLNGVPAYAESIPVAAILQLVEEIGASVHFMRISTANSLEFIAQAKLKGLPITASTTWHHLLLSTEVISSYNPNLKLQPPLGNPEDRLALIEAVKSGVIDAIAIDHTPFTYEEKMVSFAESPPGAIGLQIALSLLWKNIVVNGYLTPLELWGALTINSQSCLGVSYNYGDWILFDPHYSWVLDSKTCYSHSANSYWIDQSLEGKVLQTFYRTSFELNAQ
jgi:dihydroorotase